MAMTCPYCQKTISVPDAYVGKTVKCPDCGRLFEAEHPSDVVRNTSSPQPITWPEPESAEAKRRREARQAGAVSEVLLGFFSLVSLGRAAIALVNDQNRISALFFSLTLLLFAAWAILKVLRLAYKALDDIREILKKNQNSS